MRKGFLKYGSIGYFDANFNCIGIYICAYNEIFDNEDDDWEPKIYRVSCLFLFNYELFVKCYWIKHWYNIAIKECLPKNHCLYRLCNIFNIGTISSINESFRFCHENGLFHRLFGLNIKN